MDINQVKQNLNNLWEALVKPTLTNMLNKQEWVGVYHTIPVPCISGCNVSLYAGFEAADSDAPTGTSITAGSPVQPATTDHLESFAPRMPPKISGKGFVKPARV
jgi:hypothetical protein